MADIDTILNEMAKVMKPIVERIEASPEVTKGHYGDYMVTIDRMAGKRGTKDCLAVAVALIRAGANEFGVKSALRVMGHI